MPGDGGSIPPRSNVYLVRQTGMPGGRAYGAEAQSGRATVVFSGAPLAGHSASVVQIHPTPQQSHGGVPPHEAVVEFASFS